MRTHVLELGRRARDTQQASTGSRGKGPVADNRPEAVAQRRLIEQANNSTRMKEQRDHVAQLTGAATTVVPPGAAAPTETGLPENLKAGIESLSGLAMDQVKVHYNSPQPAQLSAHAYAQGNEIHLAPGQERHLPHEAWHVAQQAQGRVQPMFRRKEGVPVNDDKGLEHEADVMGERAASMAAGASPAGPEARAMPRPFPAVMQTKPKNKPEEKKGRPEERPQGLENEIIDGAEYGYPGSKYIHDPYDQTITAIMPDGRGAQLTYVIESKQEDPQAKIPEYLHVKDFGNIRVRITNLIELSPLRVKALGFLDAKQGTLQEKTKEETANRLKADHKEGEKKRAKWLETPENKAAYDQYLQKLKEYGELVASTPKGQKKPAPPPPPKNLPADPRSTLCNSFTGEFGTDISPIAGDTGDLKKFDPSVEGQKRQSWRTLKTNPEGPKPGDVYSLGVPGDDITIKHSGVFKSKRPADPAAPDGIQIWTVIDGGQGDYAGQQKILERTRYFNPKTQILSTKLADSGQSADDRSLRGWIDIDAHFKAPEAKTK